jgi:hypothetical protein
VWLPLLLWSALPCRRLGTRWVALRPLFWSLSNMDPSTVSWDNVHQAVFNDWALGLMFAACNHFLWWPTGQGRFLAFWKDAK